MVTQTRIIEVYRKPSKCPVCGSQVVDIIYGTGDMTEMDFLLEYRKQGVMGGDNIPRRPPIWACSCGCKRFRKINMDGSDAEVKVKILSKIRKAPASRINWGTSMVERALESGFNQVVHHFKVNIVTELGEKETLSITAVNGDDAEDEARALVAHGRIGLKGLACDSIEVFDCD